MAWLTDIHLNFVGDERVRALAGSIDADAVVITGDVSEAPHVVRHLELFGEAVEVPVYFVLGNHDYYRGTFDEVRDAVRAMTARGGPAWLPAKGLVPLTEDAALLGCDGWGDARFGDFAGSSVFLNDYVMIRDLVSSNREALEARLNAEGDRWAAWVQEHLPAALDRFAHVVFATHVPPFEGACWHEGQISDANWLPHFTCAAVGNALLECAARRPDHRITVLCGHTHGAGTMRAADNVEVWTGGADYGEPRVERVIEID